MAKEKVPVTPAVRLLREKQVNFVERFYAYEDRGGTEVGARELGVDERAGVKTLIMEDEKHNPLIVLMHGDKQVSTKKLARFLGVKTIAPCRPEVANKHTGYLVGGTSPFGTRRPMPVYMEKTILDLPVIYINGGKRGFLLEMNPHDVARVLQPVLVNVAVD